MKKWLSANDISKFIGKDKRVVNRWASRESWSYRSYTVRGGQKRRYHIKDLPEDVQLAYAVSLQTTLEALREELKPLPKAPVKHIIEG
ncbi:MAG: hypothetical protein LBD79_05730, partial [Treponema sp.]|nr:hypothetical protein [Treponema sp.]